MERKHCAGVILEKNDSILLNKRSYEPSKNKLDIVGGFVEEGESMEEAAIREAKEETGYSVILKEKLLTIDSSDNGPETLHIFIGEIADGKLSKSVEGDPVWLNIIDIKKGIMAFPHTYEILKAYLKYKKSVK
jgi:8-oxo-dGTP diphosphatase